MRTYKNKSTPQIKFTELWYHRRTQTILGSKRESKKGTVCVADIGVGKGDYLYLYPSGLTYILGDVSINTNLRNRAGQEMHILSLDAHNLPFRDKSIDVIISHQTIEHLNNVAKFRNEILRVLIEDGFVILSTPVKGPLGFGLHNVEGRRCLGESHINEFRCAGDLVYFFCNKKRLQLITLEKRPVHLPIKKYLPRIFVQKYRSMLDRFLVPMFLYYYDLLAVFKKPRYV